MKECKESKTNTVALVVTGLVGVTMLAGIGLVSDRVFADDSAVDDVTITVPTACTMSGVVDSAHTTSMQAATYSGTGGIGKTTLTTHCNDNNGFSIYAVGFTNDTDGTNTLVGTTSSQTINTGIYTSGATDSSWSMKVSKVTDSSQSYNPQNMTITNSFDNWHTVPTSYTKVAEYHAATGSSTTDTVLGAKVETTYDAYISRTQTADTYTGKVKYVMVHPYTEEPLQPQPSTAGTITYYANASDSVGTMGTQSATDGASVTLYPSNFSRTGYGFAGWSDKFDYLTNSSAHFYGPNETITAPEGTTANGLSLYAVWVASTGSLQDANKVATLCGTGQDSLTQAPIDGTANLSSVSALTDQRDNQTYAIAKLADGNCWMIENLRLENTASHNTDGSLAQGYNSSFIGLAAPQSDNFSNSTVANSLYSIDGSTDATILGNYQGYRFPRYNNFNTQQRAANTTNTNLNTYSYGNYYTWHAAIADTTHHSDGRAYDTTSICPKGWGISKGFSKLDVNMGGTGSYQYSVEASNRWRKYPTNILYSGYFDGSSASSRGSKGHYLSPSSGNDMYLPLLTLESSLVYPGSNSNYKSLGYSIRCMVASS